MAKSKIATVKNVLLILAEIALKISEAKEMLAKASMHERFANRLERENRLNLSVIESLRRERMNIIKRRGRYLAKRKRKEARATGKVK